jgi:DNA-binding beta-propeller fold protein YncE
LSPAHFSAAGARPNRGPPARLENVGKMDYRQWLAAPAAAMLIAAGSDSAVETAQSLTIPTVCADAAQCAAFCRSAVERGRSGADFIELAAYQLGLEKPIDLPPANLTMPAPVDQSNVYAGAGVDMLSPAVAGHLSRVYSPNLTTGKVDVIDPETFKVIDSLAAIPSPEHIVPSWDLQTLWVSGDISYRGGHADVMPIDPKTGKLGQAIVVPDSYNMYFTPDGKSAIVVAEAMRRLEFRDPRTMALQGYINTPKCAGINHADFSPDGAYAIFTCEFNDALAKIDLVHHRLVETLPLTAGHMPQDIRVAPDGKAFFVADMLKDGVIVIDGDIFGELGFIPTGVGAHGLYPSRDGTKLYVANRGTHNMAGVKNGQGSVSVLDFATRKVVATWTIPGGGSPDMGNLSADGKWLWLSGRYDGVIYAFNTDDGSVKTIPVGGMPHGLTVWPQPGRYSLGHTGIMR